MFDMETWPKGMWICIIGFGVLMLMVALRFAGKVEEMHHRELFKTMNNSSYIAITEHMLEHATKREKKRIRLTLHHILTFPEPFFEDGRICEEDMKKAQPLIDEWRKTHRLILAFPLAWIIAFTIAMEIYVD